MFKMVALMNVALVCAAGTCVAQPAAGPGRPPGVAMAKQRDALLAQCPPPASVREATTLPIHVTTSGTSGPRVLVIHGGVQGGLGGGPKTFAKQEALSKQGWQVEIVDRPGFGQSPTRGVDDMEADSVWIADKLGTRSNLVAHSWGGAEALLAAARRPDAIRSLVLVEPALQTLLIGNPIMEQVPALKADAEHFLGLLMSARTPGEYGLSFAQSLGASNVGGSGVNDAASTLKAHPQQAAGLGCALLQARMAPPAALRQAAETVAKAGIPVLIITGGWSPFFDAVGEVAAKLTHGHHVVISSPNHFVQLASAEEFNKVVDAFMRQADATRGTPANTH